MDTISVNEKLTPGTDLNHITPILLPKAWEPSKEYLEISRGIGIGYEERVVPKYDVQSWIHAGWSITRLSKLSQTYVNTKWMNAIIAMERQND